MRAPSGKMASGSNERICSRPSAPPTTSTHSWSFLVLRTCATKRKVEPLVARPLTATGSPGRKPAHRSLRTR